MTGIDALDTVLRQATRVRVRAGDDVVLDVDDPGGLAGLRAALAVVEVSDSRCMCWGDVAFEFAGAGGRRIAVVRFHHAVTLRWSGWDGDAVLHDGRAAVRWLAERGVTGPW